MISDWTCLLIPSSSVICKLLQNRNKVFPFYTVFVLIIKKIVICAHCKTCCLGRMYENSWNMSEKIWKIYELPEKFLRGYVFVCSGKTGLNPDPSDPTQRVLKYKSSIWGNPIQKAKIHRIFFFVIFFKI